MRRLMVFGFGLAAVAAFVACVGDGPSTDTSTNTGDGSSGSDGTTGDDGSTVGDGSAGGDSGLSCDPGFTACGTSCINVQGSDENNCGRCDHSCQGDGCTAGKCNAVDLNTTLTSPTTVATTDNTDQVAIIMAPKIYRIPKAGGDATAMWTGSTVVAVGNASMTMTSDIANKECFAAMVALSSTPTTAEYTELEIGTTPPAEPVYYDVRSGVTLAANLAGDDQAVGGDVALQASGLIEGCPLGHCTPAGPEYQTSGSFSAVAVQHGAPGSVLWTDSTANIRSCLRGSDDAGVCTPTALLTTPPADASPTKYLVVTSTKVFWVVTGSTHFRVLSCPFPGPCASATVLVDNEQSVDGFAADDNGIYWSNKDTGAVRECRDTTNGCGSSSDDLVTDLSSPGWLTMDSKFVFVVQAPSSGSGKLTRVAR